jgi:hypothetical protein
MAAKPTKQQVAQAKARAGGNNPIKVTNAGLKKLGEAAVIAASFAPAGRAVKAVASTGKAVRRIQAKQMVKRNKQAVNMLADIQQKVKAEKIAKNSVKVVGANPLSRASKNIKSNTKVQEAKSGDAAKRGAKDAAESNRRNSPYKENQVVRVKSGNAEPYKITGGAGSTARRTGEVIKRAKKKGKK